MKRVLVTGSEGQLGRAIQKISKSFPDLEYEFHNSETMDITDSTNIASIFLDGNFDYCINCAAYTNVNQAEKHPKEAFAVNAEGVRNIAVLCQKHQVILIHISTDYVFDGEKEDGYSVHDFPNPINAYGRSKLAGEEIIQELLKQFYIVRTSWLYSEYGTNFYKTILQKAKAGEMLSVTDKQTGCPTHAVNLAQFILQLIVSKNKNFGLYHFTDGEVMTWYEFAKRILIENELGDSVQIKKARDNTSLVNRPKHSVLI